MFYAVKSIQIPTLTSISEMQLLSSSLPGDFSDLEYPAQFWGHIGLEIISGCRENVGKNIPCSVS